MEVISSIFFFFLLPNTTLNHCSNFHSIQVGLVELVPLSVRSRPSAEEQSLLQSETGVPTNSVEHDSSDFSPQENGED